MVARVPSATEAAWQKRSALVKRAGGMPQRSEYSVMEPVAKHFFRHLHNWRALRNNAIARRYPLAGLDPLHDLVRRSAERCRDRDIADGLEEQAVRQYVIVAEACLGGKTLAEVAKQLGLSTRQCYRERAAICSRIAMMLQDDRTNAATVPRVAEISFLLSNVLRRAALGDTQRALSDCDALAHSATSLVHRLQALRAKATVLTDSGSAVHPPEVLRQAQQLWATAKQSGSETATPVARAAMALLHWQLAYVQAETGQALAYAHEATNLLRSSNGSSSPLTRELYCESLYALGTARCNAGDFQGALECFSLAEQHLTGDRAISFTTRSRIGVTAWKLRCALLTSAHGWRPLSERSQGLVDAFELAYATGDFAAAITALDTMTQQHATAGNDAEAFHAAQLALLLADQQSSLRVRSQLAIRLALKLLPTRYSRQAVALAKGVRPDVCDGYHRQLIAYFRLEEALAQRRYRDVLRLADTENDGRDYAALKVHRSLVRADAAFALGDRSTARALIDEALPAAERLSSAHTLLDAYRVAARVTGMARYRHRAREIAGLFAS